MSLHEMFDDVPLTGGEWRRDGLILRWHEFGSDAPKVPERSLEDLVACPKCQATVTEQCRTKNGHPSAPHASRLVPRQCHCGATLEPNMRKCAGCVRAADLARKREAYQRTKEQKARRAREVGHAA